MELNLKEHGITLDGFRFFLVFPHFFLVSLSFFKFFPLTSTSVGNDGQKFGINTYFDQNFRGKCTPRSVFCDIDIGFYETMMGIPVCKLFNASNFISGNQEQYLWGSRNVEKYANRLMERVRKLVENCDSLQVLFCSILLLFFLLLLCYYCVTLLFFF